MKTPKWKKIAILIAGLLENLFFSGAILGWSGLYDILKQEGYICNKVGLLQDAPRNLYSNSSFVEYISDPIRKVYNTSSNDSGVLAKSIECKDQDHILNLAYTMGAFTNGFTAFIWGFLLDRWGLRKVRLIINICLSIGYYLLANVTKARFLLFPAIFLISVGGVPLRIVNMQIANLFPKKRSTIITFYSGAFSASTVTFAIVKYMYDVGISYYYSVFIIFLVSCVSYFYTFFLLPSFAIQDEENSSSQEALKDENSITNLREIFKRKQFEIKSPVKLEKFNYMTSPSADEKELPFNHLATIYIKDLDYPSQQGVKTNDVEIYISKLEPLSLKQSLLSISCILHQWWFSWKITYLIVFAGSLSLWINRVGTNKHVTDSIVIVYGSTQILALGLAPLAGFWMDHQVNKATQVKDPFEREIKTVQSAFLPMLFTSFTLLGSVVCKFFDNLTAVYLSFIFLIFLRSFFVAIGAAFLRLRFPAEHYLKLLGILSTIASIISILQFPLFVWEANGHNSPFWVNVVLFIGTLISFLNPLHLAFGSFLRRLMVRERSQPF